MEQNKAAQEVCHRVHQRAAEEQGQPRTLKAPFNTQIPCQPLLRHHSLLLLRQQARGSARAY